MFILVRNNCCQIQSICYEVIFLSTFKDLILQKSVFDLPLQALQRVLFTASPGSKCIISSCPTRLYACIISASLTRLGVNIIASPNTKSYFPASPSYNTRDLLVFSTFWRIAIEEPSVYLSLHTVFKKKFATTKQGYNRLSLYLYDTKSFKGCYSQREDITIQSYFTLSVFNSLIDLHYHRITLKLRG